MAARRLLGLSLAAVAAARRVGLVLCLATISCIQDDGRRWNPLRSFVEVTEDDERNVGASVDEAIREHVRLIDDPVVLGFLHELGQSMVATIEPQPFVYRFRVIVYPGLNAFAVPGGYVYINTGTMLSASSVDELAGVVGHEIAHVKLRHYARGREKTAIPDLLATLGGLAVAVASGEGAATTASQGVNVALQLRFSREFEREADDTGSVFMARVGYDPAGMGRFFERILATHGPGMAIPAYLYSHPALDERVARARARHDATDVLPRQEVDRTAAFRDVQARLAFLLALGRESLRAPRPPEDRVRSDPWIAEADALREAGDPLAATALLREAETRDPLDPRIPLRIGELLEGRGRRAEAIEAYRRAVELDSSTALGFYRLGLAQKAEGRRHDAVFYLEQALHRSGPSSDLATRARWEIETLTFPPIAEAGLADGSDGGDADTVAGRSRERFSSEDARAAWWARVGPRYADYRDQFSVRWTDPSGRVVQEEPVEKRRRPHVASVLALEGEPAGRHGIWRVEALLRDGVVDQRAFHLTP